MTIGISYDVRCDFCGAVIESQDYRVNAGIAKPEMKSYFHYTFGNRAHYDLCADCAKPIHDAIKDKIEQLRRANRLVGMLENY
jgi:hypothetical protein